MIGQGARANSVCRWPGATAQLPFGNRQQGDGYTKLSGASMISIGPLAQTTHTAGRRTQQQQTDPHGSGQSRTRHTASHSLLHSTAPGGTPDVDTHLSYIDPNASKISTESKLCFFLIERTINTVNAGNLSETRSFIKDDKQIAEHRWMAALNMITSRSCICYEGMVLDAWAGGAGCG